MVGVFAPYTPVEKCVGKELKVRFEGEEYTGLLAGLYTSAGVAMIVLTPMREGGGEIHIPMARAVVIVKPGQ